MNSSPGVEQQHAIAGPAPCEQMAGDRPRLTIERRVGDASFFVLALDEKDVRRLVGLLARASA